MGKKSELIGGKFGKLLVLEEAGKTKQGSYIYKCLCECGTIVEIRGYCLKNGNSKSCGCYHIERATNANITHGMSNSNEFKIWADMIQRCENPKNSSYKDYGGRGIKVCDRWLNSFENFFADMGLRPTLEHSVDRYPDNDGNYEPSNCRWATNEQQNKNKRNNRWLEYDGVKMIMEDWSKVFGINQSTLHEHLQTKDFGAIYNFYKKKNEKLSL